MSQLPAVTHIARDATQAYCGAELSHPSQRNADAHRATCPECLEAARPTIDGKPVRVTVERLSGAEYMAQWTGKYEQRRERDARSYLNYHGRERALAACREAERLEWQKFDRGEIEDRDEAMYLGEVAERLAEILEALRHCPDCGAAIHDVCSRPDCTEKRQARAYAEGVTQ
jgi:hypothetical protein